MNKVAQIVVSNPLWMEQLRAELAAVREGRAGLLVAAYRSTGQVPVYSQLQHSWRLEEATDLG